MLSLLLNFKWCFEAFTRTAHSTSVSLPPSPDHWVALCPGQFPGQAAHKLLSIFHPPHLIKSNNLAYIDCMHNSAAYVAKTLLLVFYLIQSNCLSLKYNIFAAPSLNPNLPLSLRDVVVFWLYAVTDDKNDYPLKGKDCFNSKQLLSKLFHYYFFLYFVKYLCIF